MQKSLLFHSLVVCLLSSAALGSKSKVAPLQEFSDQKDLKKLLRTKNNVLIGFLGRGFQGSIVNLLAELAEAVRGQGTVATVNCEGGEGGRKLCKKLKVDPGSASVLKHYKDGEFHLDYNRPLRLQSLITFMLDPSGDLPWNEDDDAKDVEHLADPAHFNKFFKKERGRVLVMFYAPWCGYCKRMKPDYQLAARDLKGTAIVAAMDVTKPENGGISKKYNITGFPTLLFFEGGSMKYAYPGDNDRKSIVSFLENPSPEAPKKEQEVAWKDVPSDVQHLTETDFDEFMAKDENVLVMFYAPWCGHCKRMKPNLEAAAEKIKELGVSGHLAAVDCTVENALCKKFDVTGYPTVLFFRSGVLAFTAGHVRETDEIVAFMQDPKEPPPPPPPETPWAEEEDSSVAHLGKDSFKAFLKKKKHALVMFYAPWCGHCKKAKPEITEAAEELKDNAQVAFCGVDCTVEKALCAQYEVSGYPTFKYFRYFDQEPMRKYDGGRDKAAFVAFMRDPDAKPAASAKPAALSPEEDWKGHEGADLVAHLTDGNFKQALQNTAHALVAFYAPWCGHCKSMKADFAGAALQLKDEQGFAMAAVDATVQVGLGKEFDVRGYPTIKYFRKGSFVEDYNGGRRKMDFVEFLRKEAKSKDEL